ncbi:hypothetical protein RRG08_063409 [Elysia crispata]|uniref:Uncharacterized protein n=1 Tax=Elysia crispata TaxID=231223 RepID=A0AAE1ABR9_9GAST|nr:hypothetical protein RRG08_063409 [Elysia crispata]
MDVTSIFQGLKSTENKTQSHDISRSCHADPEYGCHVDFSRSEVNGKQNSITRYKQELSRRPRVTYGCHVDFSRSEVNGKQNSITRYKQELSRRPRVWMSRRFFKV